MVSVLTYRQNCTWLSRNNVRFCAPCHHNTRGERTWILLFIGLPTQGGSVDFAEWFGLKWQEHKR